MQAAVVALGGVVAGIYSPELLPGASEFEANQGCMIIVLDASKFRKCTGQQSVVARGLWDNY